MLEKDLSAETQISTQGELEALSRFETLYTMRSIYVMHWIIASMEDLELEGKLVSTTTNVRRIPYTDYLMPTHPKWKAVHDVMLREKKQKTKKNDLPLSSISMYST